ncbi:MAG: PAS domain S-box protein [Paludibacter sp.]
MENSESELLRQRAEELLQSRLSEKESQISEADALKRMHELEVTQIELELQNDELKLVKEQDIENRKLIHTIEVQQIELELQNEELRLAHLVAEETAQKYADLYDFAPTAYFTFSQEAEIIELNLTAAIFLGKERARLLNSKFGFFVSNETKVIFNLFLDKVFGGSNKATCEIELITDSNSLIHAHLTGKIDAQGNNCLVNVVDITERKKAEKELKETKLLLQSSIESQKEMIIISIDKDYNYLYFNELHRVVMTNHYGNKVMVGMNMLENITTDEDRNKFKANCDRALSGENHTVIEEYGVLKRNFYEARYNPIVNDENEIIGVTIFSENISKRILAETQLRDSELFVKSIIDSLTAHIAVLDHNGVILAVNEAWKNFAKENESTYQTDYLGVNYLQTYQNSYKNGDINALTTMQGIRAVIDGSHTQFNTVYPYHSPHKEHWFTLSAIPLNNSSRNVVLIHQDITERRMAEETLRNSELQLKKALLASTELIDSKSTNIDFEKINNTILEISGAICSVFNLYDEKEAIFTTKAIGGFNNIHKKASTYLGFEIINKTWKLDPALEAKINNNIFHECGPFHELIEDYIPKPIVRIIEKTFNMGNIIIVRVKINNVTIGDVTLLFAKGKSILNKEIVELYANQVGLFIKRIQTAASIRENEDALNKVLLANNEFIESNSDTIDYGKMTDSILSLTGAKCVVYNSFEDNGIEYKTKAISGFMDVRKLLTSLLGYELINKKWKYDDVMSSKIKNNAITRFKSLRELTGIIPKPIAKLIDKTFNLGEVAIAKINIYGKDEGYFTLFFGGGNSIQNIRIVELYNLQAGLFIKRKQTEAALKSSEQMLQNILEHFPGDVFWKDTQSTFLGCNSSFAKSAGLDNQTEIIQKTDFDLERTKYEANNFRDEDFEVINTGIAKLHMEEMRLKTDGSVVWSDTNKIPLKDSEGNLIGLLGVVTNITERKLAQDALKKLNEELEGRVKKRTLELEKTNNSLQQTEVMFRTVADFTYGWEYWRSELSEIVYMSPSVERITGYKVEDFIRDPKLLDLIIHPNDKELWENHIKGQNNYLQTKKHRELKFRIITKNNEICWIGHVCKNVYVDGKFQGTRVSNRDITEKVKAEHELLNVTLIVEERERNRFSSELHDGMGPLLSTIKLYFQWLSETTDVEKIKFITEKGNHSIEVAIQTVREISHGLSTLSLNKFGYVDSLKDFCERINATQKVKIDFTYNSKDKFGVFLETTLYRISTELIKNTLTHADAAQIKIEFHYYVDKNKIIFTYTDDGIGFDFDEKDNSGKGLGLLSIQQRINSARGKINFKSKKGSGMKVSIDLPVDYDSN